VKKLRQATVSEIAQVPGFGTRTAEAVHAALAGERTDSRGESQT
jgi:excinuclease ABC subunit C